MSKSRVVLINNIITPYTHRVYQLLSRQGMDLHIVSCNDREPTRHWGTPWEGERQHYEHLVLKGHRVKLGANRFAYWNVGIEETLSKIDPDIVIVGGFYPTMLIAARWALRHGKPLALTIDGWAPTMPNSAYHRLVRPWLLKRCSAVITCSSKGREYFLDKGVADRSIFTVPLVPAWDPPASVASFAERDYHLLWVAHMNNHVKNFSFFIKVALAIKNRIADFRVRLVGQGEAAEEGMAALRAANVPYLHDTARNWWEMEEVYRSARLLALPSLWEPWGLVCNEALQAGVPCIVSPLVGASADLVQDGYNGFVRPLDVEVWADVISKFVVDETAWTGYSWNARSDIAARTLQNTANAFRSAVEHIDAVSAAA